MLFIGCRIVNKDDDGEDMRGCIIAHGLTGTPACVNSISRELATSGFAVAAPCLAGHGGSVGDLSRVRWQDWYESVRGAYEEMTRYVDRVYFAGISLGALLGLKLAQDEGPKIRALALLGTPLVLPMLDQLAVPIVRYTPLRLAIRSVSKDFNVSVADPRGRFIYRMASLPRIPAASIYQLVSLQKQLMPNLKGVSNPMLLVHSERDRVAPARNVDILKKTVASDLIDTILLKDSEHVVTLDREKDTVAREIVSFFEKVG